MTCCTGNRPNLFQIRTWVLYLGGPPLSSSNQRRFPDYIWSWKIPLSRDPVQSKLDRAGPGWTGRNGWHLYKEVAFKRWRRGRKNNRFNPAHRWKLSLSRDEWALRGWNSNDTTMWGPYKDIQSLGPNSWCLAWSFFLCCSPAISAANV